MKKPSIKEWLEENIDNYQDRKELVTNCVKELNVCRKAVTNKLSEIKLKSKNYPGLISKTEFIDKIDKVKQTIDYLDKNIGDDYIDSNKLRLAVDVSTTKWQQMIKLPLIAERMFIYQNAANQRIVVFSSKKGVELAKTTISMSRYEQ